MVRYVGFIAELVARQARSTQLEKWADLNKGFLKKNLNM